MAEFLAELFESVVSLPGNFLAIGARDPIAGVLLLLGAVLVLATSAYVGYLTVRAALEPVVPSKRQGVSHRP